MIRHRSLIVMILIIGALFASSFYSKQTPEDATLSMLMGLVALVFLVYYYYWLLSSKNDINSVGAHIPHGIFAFIPLVHFWFLYRYAQGFAHYILHSRTGGATALYTILLWFFPFIAMPVIQWQLNKRVAIAYDREIR